LVIGLYFIWHFQFQCNFEAGLTFIWQLKVGRESKLIAGWFTAGQINGIDCYEEAAAQGLMAGFFLVGSASRKMS
jgi:tRNA U34 5-carboxymethylaminomethyl modifying enzyme MnmG/GidA